MTRPRINWGLILPCAASAALVLSLGFCTAKAIAGSETPAQVNRAVNRIQPHADPRLSDGRWDCEDYAFAKLARLNDPGARVWRVRTDTGPHAVVVTSDGRVMDNLFSDMPTRASVEKYPGYVFERVMRHPDDQFDWAAVFATATQAGASQ